MQATVRRQVAVLWLHALWIVALFALARGCMQAEFLGDEVAGRGRDLLRMHLTGLRFDVRVACVAVAPVLLAMILAQRWEPARRHLRRVAIAVAAATSAAAAALALVNHYYYDTFHAPIDLFLFELWDDDTTAVLQTVVSDYPLVRALLATSLAAALPAWWTGRLLASAPDAAQGRNGARALAVLLLHVPLLLLGGRSSFGTFPIRRAHAQVSEVAAVNALVPNAAMALQWAYRDHRADARFERASLRRGRELEQQLGYASRSTTPHNAGLAALRPHVVVALMESFGANMLAFDDPPRFDLLGRLRPHWSADFVFRRFLSASNATSPSFMALYFQSPVDDVSQTSARKVRLAGAPFDVYAKAGYRVVFITAGNLQWRSLSDYLRTQGATELYDENSLMDRYPEARAARGAWGVPDEYAFRLAGDLLREAREPTFVAMLTISNHPPVELPASYAPGPLEVPAELVARLVGDPEHARETALGYQYACDALGGFLERVKSGELSRPTVVAATGDHHVRQLDARRPEELVYEKGVPLFLHVPAEVLALRPWRMDALRPGSHKDVFPTLYAASLSDAEHLSMGGRDLLAPEDDPARAFGIHSSIWIDARGAQLFEGSAARHAWASRDAADLHLLREPAPLEADTAKRIERYWALLRWNLDARVAGTKD